MADITRLLRDEKAGWAVFSSRLAAIPQERWGERTVTPEGWSPVTIVVHVAGWLDECARVLEAMAAGTWDPAAEPAETPESVEALNAIHAARAAALTRADAEVVLAAARRRARAAAEALKDVSADAWAWFEESGPTHYAKHAHDLRAWLDGTPGDPAIGRVLQAEALAWVPFAVLLDAVPPARRDEPGDDGWTVVDAVHHLARWMETVSAGVGANVGWRADGGADVARLVDDLNAGFLAESASTSYGRARLRLEDARTALRHALAALAAPSEAALETFTENTVEHYAEHEPLLRRLRGPATDVP